MTVTPALKRVGRLGLRLVALIVALCFALLVGFGIYATCMLPPLQPWHTTIL